MGTEDAIGTEQNVTL